MENDQACALPSPEKVDAERAEMIREGLEYLEQGFSIFDRELRLAAWNRRFLELLEFPGEMGELGRPLADFFRFNARRGDYGPGAIETLVQGRLALAAKAEPHCFERVRPNGTVIEVLGRPLPSGGFVTTYTDITQRRGWENELETARQTAEQANRAKSDLLNAVSHDLRTPLTSVLSFSEILSENPDLGIEERGRFLGIIKRESQRLIRMISELLDFAKIEAGSMKWRTERLDLKELIEMAAASVTPLFEDKEIDLVLDLPSEVPLVHADGDRLTQVIVNLLSNAQKFAPAHNGRVRVSVAGETGQVTVAVADNGPGIPVEQLEEIFEDFRQVVAHDGSHPPGTGLGLAICRRIVTRLGGRIWVESVPREATVFRFTVPLND